MATVLNPQTGRGIRVGGRAFQGLIRDGYLYARGVLQRPPILRVRTIRNPSDDEIEERFYEEVASGATQLEAVRALVEDDGGVPGRGLFRDTWYDAQVHEMEVEFEDGTIQGFIFADDLDDDEEGTVVSGHSVVAQLTGERILHDQPLRLPFTNVRLNAGDDDRCLSRWLGIEVPDPTIEGLMEATHLTRVKFEIVDVFGVRIVAHGNILGPGAPRALLYQGHVYPLAQRDDGRFIPALMTGPVYTYTPGVDDERIKAKYREHHAAVYRKDKYYYVGGYGIFSPRSEMEDWMGELSKALGPPGWWDAETLTEFKAACLPLYMMDAAVTPRCLATIDVRKCYYNTLAALMAGDGRESTWSIFTPDLFTRPEAFHPERGVNACDWVVIDSKYLQAIHQVCGLHTTLLCYPLFYEIARLMRITDGIDLQPILVYRFQPMKQADKAKAFAYLHESGLDTDAYRQKKYAIVNGALGHVTDVRRYEIELGSQYVTERRHYARRHQMTAADNAMVKHVERTRLLNQVHIHASVIQHASAHVVRVIRSIRVKYGLLPSRVKTDSLSYDTGAFRPAMTIRFQPGNRAVWTRMLCDQASSVSDAFEWRIEEDEVPALRIGRDSGIIGNRMRPYTPEVCRSPHVYTTDYQASNRTHIGAPGSGKTASVVNPAYRSIHEPAPDFFATMTNRNARRIGGTTLHSLLAIDMTSHRAFPRLDRFRGKRIFIDEAQSVPRWMWAHLLVLFHEANVSFTFAMDLDQLAPIEDGDRPIALIPFHGLVLPHTEDYRNDADLIAVRQRVKDGTYRPPVEPGEWDPDDFTEINIAVYRATCAWVNRHVVATLDTTWGSVGRYIIDLPERFRGSRPCRLMDPNDGHRRKVPVPAWAQQSTILRIYTPFGPLMNEDTGEIYPEQFRMMEPLLKWGFCITTDKMLGSTIREPYTIWDAGCPWFRTRHGLFYTALTRAERLSQITFRDSPPSTDVPTTLSEEET